MKEITSKGSSLFKSVKYVQDPNFPDQTMRTEYDSRTESKTIYLLYDRNDNLIDVSLDEISGYHKITRYKNDYYFDLAVDHYDELTGGYLT